jgi:hypothetical protein
VFRVEASMGRKFRLSKLLYYTTTIASNSIYSKMMANNEKKDQIVRSAKDCDVHSILGTDRPIKYSEIIVSASLILDHYSIKCE